MAEICRAIQVDLKDTIAFGDSENDINMLKTTGIGVAMKNAEQAVKDAADYITLSNNDDGIADAIRSVLCRKEF